MWVKTSLSSALNLFPHQVRSDFELSICPPSSRMKRKFPCSAQCGTSSGLARYSFGGGSKDCPVQSSKDAATKPMIALPLTIRTPSVRSPFGPAVQHAFPLKVYCDQSNRPRHHFH